MDEQMSLMTLPVRTNGVYLIKLKLIDDFYVIVKKFHIYFFFFFFYCQLSP